MESDFTGDRTTPTALFLVNRSATFDYSERGGWGSVPPTTTYKMSSRILLFLPLEGRSSLSPAHLAPTQRTLSPGLNPFNSAGNKRQSLHGNLFSIQPPLENSWVYYKVQKGVGFPRLTPARQFRGLTVAVLCVGSPLIAKP